MARSIFAGGTDYRGQSIDDIKKDLIDTQDLLKKTVRLFEKDLEKLKELGKFKYMDFDFRASTYDLINFFKTSIDDIDLIIEGINNGLNNVHMNLLENMQRLSHEKNKHHRKMFRNYYNPEYRTLHFDIIEELYQEGGDVTASMFDLGNMVERLQQFIVDRRNEMSINITNNIDKVDNLQQNSGHATGYQYNQRCETQNDIDEIIYLLKDIAEKLDKENKEELLEYVEDFNEDLKSSTPRKSRIKSTWTSIKSKLTLESVANIATITTSIPNIIDMGEKIINQLA
ncbi:hypothetical protein [Romboutsia sp. 1001713B170131_170501_G6]|uniref:hypothetical protein n=1 Tax=Romboutsia sp. 1001713B170131_170501_G6 TaxID=2787108 RepID=UPI0018A94BE6|nr:hypothetical protein [Romboutsia sp. 1001713B170131_170501_G6]